MEETISLDIPEWRIVDDDELVSELGQRSARIQHLASVKLAHHRRHPAHAD